MPSSRGVSELSPSHGLGWRFLAHEARGIAVLRRWSGHQNLEESVGVLCSVIAVSPDDVVSEGFLAAVCELSDGK